LNLAKFPKYTVSLGKTFLSLPLLLLISDSSFPGQEHVAGNSKIPSVIYYDKQGKMMAAGAEADTATVLSQVEDEGWIKAELCGYTAFFGILGQGCKPTRTDLSYGCALEQCNST
jgi:hypothetical protein